jgi:hypothetical protein
MEIYQWLLRRNGLDVSNTGYFVYCTGRSGVPKFDARIDFDIHVIPYKGKDDWVEPVLQDIHKCLNDDNLPESGPDCDYCAYLAAVGGHVNGV